MSASTITSALVEKIAALSPDDQGESVEEFLKTLTTAQLEKVPAEMLALLQEKAE